MSLKYMRAFSMGLRVESDIARVSALAIKESSSEASRSEAEAAILVDKRFRSCGKKPSVNLAILTEFS